MSNHQTELFYSDEDLVMVYHH